MNAIDKLIGAVSPGSALKRVRARAQLRLIENSGYSNYGANRTKKSLLGWDFRGGSADEDIHDNLDVLRQRSRDLYMGGATLATGAIKTMRTNVVGSGLRLKPMLDLDVLKISPDKAHKLELKIENEFNMWAESKNCDAQRMNNFYELQQLAFLSMLLNGESFTLLPYIEDRGVYGISVQLVESDKVYTPAEKFADKKIKYGIEIGSYGEPIAYYFHEAHPLSKDNFNAVKAKYKRIPAYGEKTKLPNVLHIMESERAGQLRGVPVLAPVIEDLKQLGRYTEAELVAAVVSGMFTTFITTENPTNALGMGEMISSDQQIDADDEFSYELGNGAIISLAPGEKVEDANPGRPNTAFDGFVVAISRQIGAALEIPYELLVKQFNASYSASRASLLEAWKMFKMRRSWLAADFCQPIYEQWFTEAVAKGRIKATGFFTDPMIRKAFLSCEWSGPTQGQIDPLKEVKAAESRVKNGFSTRQRETVELTGGDFIRNIRQRVKEEEMLKEVGGSTEAKESEDGKED